MPSVDQLRSRLLKKLTELFQLDQPDLDFGFYRIMHAKAQEVQDFIDKDLLKIVKDAFGDAGEARKAELKTKIENEIAAAKEYGVADPENSPKVKEALAAYEAAKDTAGAEADVYDHLYRFFERYYEDGDFISRRYYTRETPGKAAPFAVPYNGEEVKLHWANADQYYIKSSEYFTNFTFDLRQAKEVREAKGTLPMGGPETPLKVHFRIVHATEGEHGNVKASDAGKRFFILHVENPVSLNESGELVVNFEYRPDPEKSGQDKTWRDKRNSEAVETVLARLETLAETEGEHQALLSEYLRLFQVSAPTDKDKKRPVLAKYVNQYTGRNTMDYFIHKDLGGFLKRELDFYIKNEVMHLDDIENADVPTVESYLAKIKVLRKIAGKLIDFLAQLENFQKKLWLKKKFVVETNYCITLDRVPEELYSEIIKNEAQCEEWIKLFAIDEIKGDMITPGFSRPLKVGFLKANDKLVLDTRFFDEGFKTRLVGAIEDFDKQCDGLLIHSENFQALQLLQERYREQVKCTYIDPPYNTGKDGFPYKDSFQHSSWLAMTSERIEASIPFMQKNGAFFASIDEKEHHNLRYIADDIFGPSNLLADFIWLAEGNFDNQAKIKIAHEYIISYAIHEKSFLSPPVIDPSVKNDSKLFRDEIKNTIIKNGPKNPISTISLPAGFPTNFESGILEKKDITWPQYSKDIIVENSQLKEPVSANSGWSSKSLCESFIQNNMQPIQDSKGQITSFIITNTGAIEAIKKRSEKQSYVTSTIKGVGTIQSTRTMIDDMGCSYPHYPKPPSLISYITSMTGSENKIVFDYFAGSGTTGQSVVDYNREHQNINNKFILVEIGNYFETIIKPRISKVVYSENWKDGKPTTRNTGISHCCKYIRLESYEDTLNNLRFDHNPQRDKITSATPSLKEDYMLRYLLDVETRGSQSLLNIDGFADPCRYTLEVKKPGTDEYVTRAVDLVETFNYLIGLRVLHTAVPQTFQANFKRIQDPELPKELHTRLVVDGRIQQDPDGPWWFRKVEGWVPADPANPNNGEREKVLIVWRKLTGDIEQDNLILDEWFQKNRISTRDFEFDTIYVNGSNNLPNLKQDADNWKVRLIEEEFMKRMWNGEGSA